MKKLFLVLSVLVLCACGSSKKKAEPVTTNAGSLEERLSAFMKLNEEMNLEGVMDYIYPKLFSIVPRKDLLKAMKDGFNNEEVKVELDSMKVDKIHPPFEVGKGSYAKVVYSMVMIMDFNPSQDSTVDDSKGEMIRAAMAEKYGENNVTLEKETGNMRIRTSNPMVAVKDELAKEWSFVNLNEEDPMINKLFSKEVLDKLATYK